MTNSNVTPIESKQPQAVVRFTITALIDGFPVQLEGETSNAGNLRNLVARLREIGATAPVSTPEPTKAGGAPLCPVHNATMKASQKPGTFFCPKKNDDGSYCRHKA